MGSVKARTRHQRGPTCKETEALDPKSLYAMPWENGFVFMVLGLLSGFVVVLVVVCLFYQTLLGIVRR